MTGWLLPRRRERARAALAARAGGPAGAAIDAVATAAGSAVGVMDVVDDSDADAALVERLVAGDEGALRQAYRAHRAPLLRFARRLVGDAAAADDLVHEVFVRLPRAARRAQPGTPLGSFLVAVACNHARHHVRAAARRRRAQDRLALEQELGPTSAPPPDGELEHRQLVEALVHALDELPLEQRIAFVLCAVEERTSGEAAALAGTNESTMRARLFHARRKLRARLAVFDEGGTP